MKKTLLLCSLFFMNLSLNGQVSPKLSDNSILPNAPQFYNLGLNNQPLSTGCSSIEQLGNNFENGRVSNTVFPLICADDITISANECVEIEAVEVPFFTNNPGDASQINIYFFEDNSGVPGAIFATQTINPANWSTSVIGNNFGLDVNLFEITLNSNITLCGGPAGTTFWFLYKLLTVFLPVIFIGCFQPLSPMVTMVILLILQVVHGTIQVIIMNLDCL